MNAPSERVNGCSTRATQGDELFLVLTGEVRILVTQRTLGVEKELARLGPGAYFGEVSLLTGGTRTASARAGADTRLLALTRAAFIAQLARLPSLAISVCAGLARYIEANRAGTGHDAAIRAAGRFSRFYCAPRPLARGRRARHARDWRSAAPANA